MNSRRGTASQRSGQKLLAFQHYVQILGDALVFEGSVTNYILEEEVFKLDRVSSERRGSVNISIWSLGY